MPKVLDQKLQDKLEGRGVEAVRILLIASTKGTGAGALVPGLDDTEPRPSRAEVEQWLAQKAAEERGAQIKRESFRHWVPVFISLLALAASALSLFWRK